MARRTATRRVAQPGGGRWVVRTNPTVEKPKRARRRAARSAGISAHVPPMDILMRSRGGGDERQLRALLKAHGFRRSGKSWALHLPALDVETRARRNPPVEAGTYVGDLQQQVADSLHRAHVLEARTRFRQTSRGGLQVLGVPSQEMAKRPWLVDRLRRLSSSRGFAFEPGLDGFLMLPKGVSNPRSPRRSAPAGLPVAQIDFIVDRMHVGTPHEKIEADIRRRTKGWPSEMVSAAVQHALDRHHKNQELYRGVMSGRFNNPRGDRKKVTYRVFFPAHHTESVAHGLTRSEAMKILKIARLRYGQRLSVSREQ